MDNKIFFKLKTTMEEKDNRNFLYIRTFKQNSAVIMIMIVLSLIGAGILTFLSKDYTVKVFVGSWIFLFAIMTAVMVLKIELRHKQRIKEDNTGVFGNITDITFYENNLIMETSIAEGQSNLKYDDFYGLIETRNYFILYYTTAMATMLRKKDMSNVNMSEFKDFISDKFEGKYRRL